METEKYEISGKQKADYLKDKQNRHTLSQDNK